MEQGPWWLKRNDWLLQSAPVMQVSTVASLPAAPDPSGVCARWHQATSSIQPRPVGIAFAVNDLTVQPLLPSVGI